MFRVVTQKLNLVYKVRDVSFEVSHHKQYQPSKYFDHKLKRLQHEFVDPWFHVDQSEQLDIRVF